MLDLTQLKQGQKAKIIEIIGGAGLSARLDTMGIRTGVVVSKVSSQLLHGPVTIRLGNTVVAVGHGMAKKIIVAGLGDGVRLTG